MNSTDPAPVEKSTAEVSGPEGFDPEVSSTEEFGDKKEALKSSRLSRRTGVIILAALAVVLLGLAALLLLLNLRPKPTPDSVAVTVPVPLTFNGLPNKTKIGVVLTPGDPSVPGTAFNQSAQGAVVAAQRLSQGGNSIELDTKLDNGVIDGAHQAVRDLVADKVAGIVVASTGKQAQEAAAEAQSQGIPVILPYAAPASPGPGVWTFSADNTHLQQALQNALTPYHNLEVITDADPGSNGLNNGLNASRTLAVNDFDTIEALARQAAYNTGYVSGSGSGPGNSEDEAANQNGSNPSPQATAKPIDNPSDAVYVSFTNPVSAANIVKALQQQGVSVPVITDPTALSPAFATTLIKGGGAANGQLLTVGNDSGDALALRRDNLGRSMSAFLDAVRMSASQDSVLNLTGDAPFRADAWAADAKSHDAVIALAQAAAHAKSADPAKVASELGKLTLSAHDGLAGPTLNLSDRLPLQDSLVTLSAGNQNLGLRPQTDADPRVLWISNRSQ